MKRNNCVICGKKTKYGGETCSRECAGILKKKRNREYRKCLLCGEEFETKKNSKTKLCSDKCRKEWANIPENKEKRIKKSRNTIKEKYGVESFFETKQFIEKSKKTKKERYGDENYVNFQKAKKTKKGA